MDGKADDTLTTCSGHRSTPSNVIASRRCRRYESSYRTKRRLPTLHSSRQGSVREMSRSDAQGASWTTSRDAAPPTVESKHLDGRFPRRARQNPRKTRRLPGVCREQAVAVLPLEPCPSLR